MIPRGIPIAELRREGEGKIGSIGEGVAYVLKVERILMLSGRDTFGVASEALGQFEGRKVAIVPLREDGE